MTPAADADLWRAAAALIERHGAHAPVYAMQSVGLLVERGDFSGAGEWRRVLRATEQLLRTDPASPAVN